MNYNIKFIYESQIADMNNEYIYIYIYMYKLHEFA